MHERDVTLHICVVNLLPLDILAHSDLFPEHPTNQERIIPVTLLASEEGRQRLRRELEEALQLSAMLSTRLDALPSSPGRSGMVSADRQRQAIHSYVEE